jgi:hypothetical protein
MPKRATRSLCFLFREAGDRHFLFAQCFDRAFAGSLCICLSILVLGWRIPLFDIEGNVCESKRAHE